MENHTLKRALTDPRLFCGIGNAYSDEILHAARLSPVALTSQAQRRGGRPPPRGDTRHPPRLDRPAARGNRRGRSPRRSRPSAREMAVHGNYGKPCPVCGTPVQRIVYADNETNYCPTCQTGGRLLADRSLSRLLKGDWPKSLEEMEESKDAARGATRRPASARSAMRRLSFSSGRCPSAASRSSSEVRALAGRGNRARDRGVREDPLQEELGPRGAAELRRPRGQGPREDAQASPPANGGSRDGDALLPRERQDPSPPPRARRASRSPGGSRASPGRGPLESGYALAV